MASVSSLSFVSETKTESFAILLRNNGYSRSSRFPFFATLPRKTPEPNLFKSLRLVSKAPRAIGEENSEESESRDESEDSIQATIEKSKKVLAMQRELLQQIAERKKLIASIKDSTVESGEEDDPYELEQTTSLKTSLTSEESVTEEEEENGSALSVTPQAESVKQWKDAISSKPSAEQPKVKNVTKLPVSETETKPRKDIFAKKKVPPQVGLVKEEKNSGFDTLPSFLSSASEVATPKNDERVKAKEPSLKLASNGKVDAEKEVAKPPPLAGANVMNILIVAAECAPWSKTGGLGDVAGALPKALARRGHRVMVVVPLYGNYSEPKDTGVRRKYKICNQEFEVGYSHSYIDGVDFVFIDNHMFRNVQSNIYGGNRSDILRRMVLFCKAAVEVPWHVPCGGVCYGDGNLAFIANDWHTALLPVYLKAYYRDNGLMTFARSTLVIHNIAHQGRGPVDDFSMVDLPHHYLDLFKLYDPVGGEHFNIFAAGLKTADRIVTVSHGYAWELKTIEGGWGLHGVINDNDWKLRGIVNGIDTDEWSPELDAHLTTDGYSNYSLETLSSGKPKCKAALQRELGLPVRSDVPLIGFIGRLDQQKGVDLIAEAIPWIVDQDAQLVMLGTGRQDLENMLREAENHNRDKVRGWVGFSVKTSHRITAGADVLLMPSRFEPCGLNQLYAMKYGTVPVVHAVGGLRDTVHPFDPYNESGLGWTFDGAETGKLIHALGNCLFTFRDYKKSWEGLMRRGMSLDLSWDRAAVRYEEVLVAAKYQW